MARIGCQLLVNTVLSAFGFTGDREAQNLLLGAYTGTDLELWSEVWAQIIDKREL